MNQKIVSDQVGADGNWHSAGFTYDGAELIFYFDGEQVGSALPIINDIITHNYASTLGSQIFSNNSFFFHGQVRDFVVYDVVLSSTEITNYHQGNIQPFGLVLLGRMNEDEYSNGLEDSSGNGFSGISQGAIPVLDPAVPILPEHGTAIINGDGTITYTPDLGFIGEDRF